VIILLCIYSQFTSCVIWSHKPLDF